MEVFYEAQSDSLEVEKVCRQLIQILLSKDR